MQNNRSDVNSGNVYSVMAEERFTLKELSVVFEKATKTKLNINWGEKQYRDREVMIPWENGVLVPEWKSKTNLMEGILLVFK